MSFIPAVLARLRFSISSELVVDHLSDSYLHVLLKVDHGDLGEQRTAVVTGVGQGWERLRSLSL